MIKKKSLSVCVCVCVCVGEGGGGGGSAESIIFLIFVLWYCANCRWVWRCGVGSESLI